MRMRRFFSRSFCAVLTAALLFVPVSRASQAQQKPKKKEKPAKKEVLNFNGGIVFATEGELSQVTCFRLEGIATAPGFFDHFKRIDDQNGTEYRSGQKVVTESAEELPASFLMFDIPCKMQTLEPTPRPHR